MYIVKYVRLRTYILLCRYSLKKEKTFLKLKTISRRNFHYRFRFFAPCMPRSMWVWDYGCRWQGATGVPYCTVLYREVFFCLFRAFRLAEYHKVKHVPKRDKVCGARNGSGQTNNLCYVGVKARRERETPRP